MERLTLLFILERYSSSESIYLPIREEELFENCSLNMDCKVEISSVNWTSRDPIDVVAWDQRDSTGEGYECKIKINSLKESDEDILFNLWKHSNSNRFIEKFNVGIVTFSTKEIIDFLDISIDNVNIYGRNNIDKLREFNVS
ncbi:hypothetical protein MWH25_04590 [Natroniella acetigena]|uniref:hypothetical protein n=1 Tax=Natroniella acetigena TaxID=52004 RepID=UPI00200B1068|nr:hypothetical protein [Natroniella acetigena]MCK8827026.1 hypothetical protein [Natroniella acetigena]